MSTLKQNVFTMTAILMSVAACASKPATGAAVGGASGAVLGAGMGAAAAGNKGALIGAGVGAAAGAAGGYFLGKYMANQKQELDKDVKSAQVVQKGDQLVVKFNSAILFETNEANLKDNAERDLQQFADVLKKYKDTVLVIEGHTDSTGPQDFNEDLSWQRAQAVISQLASHGVDRPRMSARGLADQKPVASNDTQEGRQKNRRVEIQIAANEDLKRRADSEDKKRAGVEPPRGTQATASNPRAK